MRNIRVAALIKLKSNEMTEIWNRCWRGHYYDMSFTPEHMRAWLNLSQVSLEHSMAILVKDQIVGFALLSLDGTDGWIAGACIAPEYRRKGFFTALMRIELDVVKRAGLKRVYLEVLEQNPAHIIYESVGFARIRRLNIYRVEKRIDFPKARTRPLALIPLDTYFNNRRALFNPAWQRKEENLRRHANICAVVNSTGSAGVLFGGDKIALALDAWSTTVAGAAEVITAIIPRSRASWSLTNQPDDQITSFLEARGVSPSAKQYEMCAELT